MIKIPQFEGVLKLPGQRNIFRFNFRSPFITLASLRAHRSTNIFGALKINVHDQSVFAIHCNNDLDNETCSLAIYTSPVFPYISFNNALGRSQKCFLIFATKVELGQEISLTLTRSSENNKTTFLLGDILAVMAKNKPEIVDPEHLHVLRKDLLEAVKDGPISKHIYWNFAQRLKELNFQETANQAVDEFKILLYASIMRNHKLARKLLRKLASIRKSSEKSAYNDILLTQIDEITKPFILGPHGYRLPMSAIPLEVILTELSDAMQCLDAMDAQNCIACGTLLGFVRDGELLPHDDDIDVSILVPGETMAEVVDNWSRLMRQILDKMHAFQKNGFVALELPCGIEVDLFPMWILDGKVYAYPHLYGEFNESDFFPLIMRDWNGFLVKTPAILEPVLAINYGPDWKVSDPYWRFNWALSRKRFASFLQAVRKMR